MPYYAIGFVLGLATFFGGLFGIAHVTHPEVGNFGATVAFPVVGGTGTSTAPTTNSVLIGNSGGTYGPKVLTAGTNITFTNGGSTFTINSSGSSGGSGNVATSTSETAGQLAYWTSTGATPATLGKVATTTLAGSGVISISNSPVLIGASPAVATITGGSNGQVLGWLAGAPAWTATSSVAAGTGISISANGSVTTITNTGVTSITGTANQITASGSGAVTLSLPNHVIFPLDFVVTNSTTTNATTTSLYFTGLTSGELAVDATGKVYKAATTTAGTGLSYNGTSFNVNTTQNITTLSNLSSAGIVNTTSGGLLYSTASSSLFGVGTLGQVWGYTSSGGAWISTSTTGGSGGSSLSPWATTTSQVVGQLINYPLNTTDIVVIGSNSTTSSAEFIFDPNTVTATFGTGGAGNSTLSFGPDTFNQWITGYNGTDKTYAIASSTALGTLNALTIDKNLKTTLLQASSTGISGNYAAFGGSATTSVNQAGTLTIQNLSGLALTTSGVVSAYAGSSCGANTYNTSISSVGAVTCGQVSLTAGVTGTLPVANGGTGVATFTSSQLLYGNGTNPLSSVATTSLTATGVLTLSQPISVIGGSASALTVTGGTNGQVLAWLSGVPTWTATTTINGGAGISIMRNGGTVGVSIALNAIDNTLFYQGAANTVFGNPTGATANGQYFATSTLFTGTAGQVDYFSGTGALVGTSTLFFNTNSFVGISSTTPWAQFSINAASGMVNAPVFAIGSSSKTLFQISNTGNITGCESKPTATSSPFIIDWNKTCNLVTVNIGNSAINIQFINGTTSIMAGSRKLVEVCNSGSAAGALTWSGVEWIGTQPTQTTTANQCDAWSFYIGSATSTAAAPAWKVHGAASTGFQ